MTVTRTEHIHLKPCGNLSKLCHYSKNLYNEANYIVRQALFKTGKWIRYNELAGMLKVSQNYKALPAQTAQQTLKVLERSWKSFFRAVKDWKKYPEKYFNRPRMPGYKGKDSEFLLVFTNQQCKIRNGEIWFPEKIGLKVETRLDDQTDLREIRIVPKGVGYVLEVVYRKIVETLRLDKSRVVGIDLGLRNIATIVNNIGEKPIAVKGGVAKSINQYYNRERARLQSIYDGQGIKVGSKLQRLTEKRNRKIHDVFHKLSREIVEWCVKHDIGAIALGHNNNWKQNSNLGRRNNQNFVQIPFDKLISQIKYKAEEAGIMVIEQDENHTSKCSFLDDEPVEHLDEYAGSRVSRGLFRSSKGIIINADMNAAYNIIRKAFPEAFADGIEGVGLHPVRMGFNILTKDFQEGATNFVSKPLIGKIIKNTDYHIMKTPA
nr:transposase [Candidatus Freyarchaeota archaeon]